jgi:hypothetical protein
MKVSIRQLRTIIKEALDAEALCASIVRAVRDADAGPSDIRDIINSLEDLADVIDTERKMQKLTPQQKAQVEKKANDWAAGFEGEDYSPRERVQLRDEKVRALNDDKGNDEILERYYSGWTPEMYVYYIKAIKNLRL